ncbi:MAG: hypothetical protein NTY20_02510 [Candidatus Aenigmarchaeota archaeon]|nr:hypothetical protein [Candidatus Aenigmarchaeota archaeon]
MQNVLNDRYSPHTFGNVHHWLLILSEYKTLSELKERKIPSTWKFSMKFVALFILMIFFVTSLTFFGYVSIPIEEYFSKLVFGSFFLAGALIVTLTVKVNSMALRDAEKASETYRKMYENASKNKEEMQKKIKGMEKELQDLKRFTKHAVGRELRMIELKKEIKNLKEQLKQK